MLQCPHRSIIANIIAEAAETASEAGGVLCNRIAHPGRSSQSGKSSEMIRTGSVTKDLPVCLKCRGRSVLRRDSIEEGSKITSLSLVPALQLLQLQAKLRDMYTISDRNSLS